MSSREVKLDRIVALSDGIFAVVITIMVLGLKPPTRFDFQGLLELWPDFIAYMVSYVFIAVVWINHHFVLRHAQQMTMSLAWTNVANLFWISLIPFTTAWLAASEIASLPLTVYASVFFLVEATYIVLMWESFGQARKGGRHVPLRLQWIRAWAMLAIFGAAACAVFVPPVFRLALLASFLVLHARPNPSVHR